MEITYGVGVRNRFDLCCDDDVEDPFEILKQQEAELQKRKGEKLLKDKSKSLGVNYAQNSVIKSKKEATAPKNGGKLQEKAQEKSSKSSKVEKPLNFQPISDRNKNSEIANIPEGSWKEESRRGRGGFVGAKGPTRGGTRSSNIGFDQRGKREFDRHSGSNKSGVKPMEKREGGGAHNWGSVKDDIQFVDTSDMDEKVFLTSPDEIQLPSGANSEFQAKSKTEESGITLDEWKEKEQSARFVPTYNLRKPGEGENDSGKKWGKVYMLKKKEIEDGEEFDEEEIIKRGRQKQHIDIEIRFDDKQSHGRSKGRGFGKAGQVRGVANNKAVASTQKPAPKVDDLNDFPSL